MFAESQIEKIESILRAEGCDECVIGSIWESFDEGDDAAVEKAIIWAFYMTLK
jgi:hypothetical protein